MINFDFGPMLNKPNDLIVDDVQGSNLYPRLNTGYRAGRKNNFGVDRAVPKTVAKAEKGNADLFLEGIHKARLLVAHVVKYY